MQLTNPLGIPKNSIVGVGALLLIAAVGAVMDSRPASAQGAPNPGPIVRIDPAQLPLQVTGTVTGNTSVTGTVAATQQGTWNVGVTDQNQTSALVDYQGFSVTSTIAANNPGIGPLDVSRAKSVRVTVSLSSCGPCGDVKVAVLSSDQTIDLFSVKAGFDFDPGASVSRTYDVPGRRLVVKFQNADAGKSNSVTASVFARGN